MKQIAFLEANATGTTFRAMQMARQMGMFVHLLTCERDFYSCLELNPLTLADRVVDVNTYDVGQVCRAMSKLQCSAILAFDDYRLLPASLAARELGLPGPDVPGMLVARFKDRVRRKTNTPGNSVAHVLIDKQSVEDGSQEFLDGPAIVKPVDDSGSVGVCLCMDADEAVAAARANWLIPRNVRGYISCGVQIMERYVEGQEFSAECVWNRSEARWKVLGFTKKTVTEPPHFVEIQHVFPYGFPGEFHEQAIRTIEGWLEVIGLRAGAAHVEFKVRSGTLSLIEVNPRLPGGLITDLVARSTGVDMVRSYIEFHLGDGRDIRTKPSRSVSGIRFLLPSSEGFVSRVSCPQKELASLDGYSLPRIGAVCRPLRDNYGRIGWVAATRPTVPELEAALERAADSVSMCISPALGGPL